MSSGNFEESGVRLVLDISAYSRNMSKAINESESLDKAMLDAENQAGRLSRSLSSVDGNINVNVTVNNSELKTAVDQHAELNSNTSMKANADASELESAQDVLEDIRNLATIDLVFNVAGAVGGVTELPIVSSLIEMDNALAQIEGRTGGMIPDAEHLITDLYTNAWGESREAIAEVIIQADNLRISQEDLGTAVTTAFQVADTGIGDTTEILRAMDSLVKNQLAPDFQTAGDIIVAGLQNGGDRGQDLLDTFNEYGSTFQTLRIDAEGALGFITSGLEAGVDNSDRIADALRETGIRLREIGTNEDVANAFAQLDAAADIDLAASLDAFNAGEISGNEFFEGFFGALGELAESDPQSAAEVSASLVGTISEDFGPEVIAQLTPQWDEAMGELEGRAETASNAINNTLGTALTGLGRTIENELVTTVSEIVDIDALTEQVKTAVATIGAELRGGATLGEALEIGLELGEGTFTRLESVIGNLGLVIMQAIAGALDLLGQGEAAQQLRDSITGAAGGQLAFDLKLADDGAAVMEAVQNAISRGVESADIGEAALTSINERLATGDIAGAQAIVDALNNAMTAGGDELGQQLRDRIFGGNGQIGILSGAGGEYGRGLLQEALGDIPPELAEASDLLNAFQEIIPKLQESGGFLGSDTAIAGGLQNILDEFDTLATVGDIDTNGLQAVIDSAQAAGTNVDGMTTSIVGINEAAGEQLTALGDTGRQEFTEVGMSATTARDDIRLATTDIGADLETSKAAFVDWSAKGVESIDKIVERANYAKDVINGLNAELGADTPTAPDSGVQSNAAGGILSAGDRSIVNEPYNEMFAAPRPGAIINAAATSLIEQALSSIMGGARGGDTYNNYNIVMTNNTSVQNRAQADALGYRQGKALRGFG